MRSTLLWLAGIAVLLLIFSPGCSHDDPVRVTDTPTPVQVHTGDVVDEAHDGWWMISPGTFAKLFEGARENVEHDDEPPPSE